MLIEVTNNLKDEKYNNEKFMLNTDAIVAIRNDKVLGTVVVMNNGTVYEVKEKYKNLTNKING